MFLDQAVKNGQKCQANGNPPIQFIVAANIWLLGFLLATLSTYVAIGKALWGRRRIWLNSKMHAARRRNEFPPMLGHRNSIGRFIVLCAVFTGIVLLIGLSLAFFEVGPKAARQPKWMLVVFFCGLFGGAIVIFKCVEYVKRRITATFPSEAWNELVGGTGDFATAMRQRR